VWLVNDCFTSRPQSNLVESVYLVPTKFCELDTMIRNELMDLAILVALALRVADENDHLHGCVNRAQQGTLDCCERTRGLPMVACDMSRSCDLFLYRVQSVCEL
jgi:hypothetical protein